MNMWVYTKNNSSGEMMKESEKLLEFAQSICHKNEYTITELCDLSLLEMMCLAKDNPPDVILFSSGENSKRMASALALKLDASISTDCFGAKYVEEDQRIHWVRPVYNNSLLVETVCSKKIQIGIIRITTQDPSLSWDENIPIDNAEIVVCIGRGCSDAHGIELAKELAKVLGAAVGATRGVTDLGLLPISKQIGQTGKYIRPRVYIGVGVSGAIQHLAGMRNSDVIIAVNSDYRAPIFEQADYGIVGDLHTVLPIMIEDFKADK